MRPQAPHNPAVKTVEELADMGFAVIGAPSANDRVEFLYQISSTLRNLALCTLAYLFLEVIH